MKKPKYEVLCGAEWYTCKKATIEPKKNWLHYELSDGTIGLAPPQKWREVSIKKGGS